MADGDTLKEFLVSLGFSVKESEQKKFQYALKTTTEGVDALGKSIAAVSLALAAGMERIAAQFSQLYYTSQLTGTTVANLRALTFAANQVGVSGDTMVESVRQMHVLLQQPGGEAMVRAFTGFKGQITSSDQALNILLKHWHDMFQHGQQYMVRLEAQVLHLNETALEPMILNWGVAADAAADYARRAQNLGLDKNAQDRMAKQGTEFVRQWNVFTTEIELFYDKAYADFIGPFTGGLKSINTELDVLGGKFAHLDLGTRRFIEAGVAITGVVGALKALKTTASFLGIGGAAKAARAAAGGAGAAAPAAASGATFWGALLPFLAGAELGNLATSGPGSKEWAQGVNKYHKQFWENLRKRFDGLFHRQSYQVPGGGGNQLLHLANYETPTQGGTGYGAAGDLQSWLHGSTSFVPSVRIIDATGIFGTPGSAGGGGAGGFGGGGSGYGGGVGSLSSAGHVGRVPVNKLDAIKRLYLHARTPVSAGGLGLDQAHTMALLGNAYAESGLDPMASGDHGTSHGLFQWHNDRWTALQQSLGMRASDPLAQFDYAVKEQMKRDPGWFKRGSNLTNEFEHGFERPAHEVDRSAYAAAITRALGAMTGTALGGIHHHGDKNVTVHAPMTVTVHGDARDAATTMRATHSRILGDAVRNLAPVIA